MLINNRYFSHRPHYTRAKPTSEPITSTPDDFNRQQNHNRHRPTRPKRLDKRRPVTQHTTYANTQGKPLRYVGFSFVCFLAPFHYLSCIRIRPDPDEPATAWP